MPEAGTPLAWLLGASQAHVGWRCPDSLMVVDIGEGGARKLEVLRRVMVWHSGGDGLEESLGTNGQSGGKGHPGADGYP